MTDIEIKCENCGLLLSNGACTNPKCSFNADVSAQTTDIGFSDDVSQLGNFKPEMSAEAPDLGHKGPFLSLEQASHPIDHTGTIQFDPGMSAMALPGSANVPDGGRTRLTDDENYRVIQTVLKESVAEPDGAALESAKAKGDATDRPEISQTLQLQNPIESERTLNRLPSRSLSVPSDSASLAKKKAKPEDYSLDSKDYKIVAKAGEGGSGVVYEATQIALKRKVAVKVLKQRRMKAGSRSRTRTKELEKRKGRFLHEVHITAKLQHPNIIPLYDLGVNSHGEVFYAMKLIAESSGETEEQQSWATMVRVPPKEGSTAAVEKNVQIFEKVCDAMRYAHAEKIVHRDLKPDNVMVGNFGEVLVIDWGMALDLGADFEPFTAGGTTSYMAPEMGLHYLKQSEIHKLSHELMIALGENKRDAFIENVLDQSNRAAAETLLADSQTSEEISKLCHKLIELDAEERVLAEKVNFSSDIYLLGAILYEIAVGHPPHYIPLHHCKSPEEKHHREFWLSSNHHIQRLVQIDDPLRLSLCNIALGALQLEQSDRYQSVDELKEAIAGFKKQVQSLQLVETGRESLEKAKGGEGYLYLLPALESFRGAQVLWPEGEEAKRLQTSTACEYAQRADQRKDFDAGLSILDEYTAGESQQDEKVVSLAAKLNAGKKRTARNKRLATVGWMAAVILPIGVWLAAWMGSAQLRETNGALEIANKAAKTKLDTAASDLEKKETDLKEKQDMLAKKIKELETKDSELLAKTTELNTKTEDLKDKTKELDTQTLSLEEKKTELANKSKELETKNAELSKKTADLTEAQAAADLAQTKAAIAQNNVKAAQTKVEQLRFSSAAGEYNSLLIPIPLDLRKGKIELAQKRLETLRDGDLKPQFKNGWVARHFAKVLDVSGVEKRLGADTSVTSVLHGANGALITIGSDRGKPAAWKMNPSSGEATRLPIELPSFGVIAQAAISTNGKWLGLALDNVATDTSFNEHFWLVNLETGKRVGAPRDSKSKNDSIVGCKSIGFTGDSNSPIGLQLVTVEELSGYKGLKQRLQLVTRKLSLQQQELSTGTPAATPISATSRDQGRVRYVATLGQSKGTTSAAVVYQSLNGDGGEKLVLENLVSTGSGSFKSNKADFGQFPTAMHLGSDGNLYCGHADGRIDQHRVDQLKLKPIHTGNEHESAVTVVASTSDGKIVAGSKDGVLIMFDNDLNMVKRLVGQSDELTSVSITQQSKVDGFQLVSGGAQGHVRVWHPDGTSHDASIRKQPSPLVQGGELRLGGDNTVTCGAVDKSYAAAEVPATAYGTADGRVFYFDPSAMRSNQRGREISAGVNNTPNKLSIAPPPGSFDPTFGNFDSFGIVGDQFVLLQADGKLFSTLIDRDSKEPSSELELADATGGRNVDDRFLPLLACSHDKDFFFTNSPEYGEQILFWKKDTQSSNFQPIVIERGAQRGGRIKKMRLSPDGQWLAVIREVARTNTTGEYVTDIMKVNPNNPQQVLRSATNTNRYRVGDPAFVGFSPDSQRMVLHFHKSGVDRETWTENWSWVGNNWQQADDKRMIDDRRVSLVAWDGNNTLVTKINKRFYLTGNSASASANSKREIGQLTGGTTTRKRIRNVQPTGVDGAQYVLFNQSLERYDRLGQKETNIEDQEFSNARDVRVFGNKAVVLDDNGFHLLDADLNYVTMIARRKIGTRSLSLSKDRLAITYDVGGLCRIMDVSGQQPKEVGRFDGASMVQLSPDGKWAACRCQDNLRIYSIENQFDQPTAIRKIDSSYWNMQWLGTELPRLLVGIQSDDLAQVNWKEIDPRTGAEDNSPLRLPQTTGIEGQLVGFELAPHSQKYLTMIGRKNSRQSQMALWAIGENSDPVQLGENEGFAAAAINPVSISFSEMDRQIKGEIGTRLVVTSVASGDSGRQAKTTKIFMLADDAAQEAAMGQGQPLAKQLYNIFEIEGVVEATDGRNLIDSTFSGDGRTLLEVDDRGLKILLSKDW